MVVLVVLFPIFPFVVSIVSCFLCLYCRSCNKTSRCHDGRHGRICRRRKSLFAPTADFTETPSMLTLTAQAKDSSCDEVSDHELDRS